MEANNNNKPRWEIPSSPFSVLPNDLLRTIFKILNLFDLVMLRSSCKWFFNAVAKLHPFPKHFVLDQYRCAEYFVGLGSLSCVEYLTSLNFMFPSHTTTLAAAKGHLAMLKYLVEDGCQLNIWEALKEAINCDDISMIEYCLENTLDNKRRANLLRELIGNAQSLATLKFLHEYGCRWSEQAIYRMTCRNNVELFEYMVNNGCTVGPQIAFVGSVEMIQSFERLNLDWRANVCEDAVRKGDLNLLKFAREKGARWGRAEARAIEGGHIECLKYMADNGYYLFGAGANNLSISLSVGNVETLAFLAQHAPGRISPDFYTNATIDRRRDVIDHLSRLNISKPDSLGLTAAKWRNFEFFKWCIEKHNFDTQPKKNYDGSVHDILYVSLEACNYDTVKYIIENKLGPLVHTSLHSYFRSKQFHCNNVRIWKYVHSLEPFDFTDDMLLTSAIGQSSPELLDWMTENGAKFTSQHVGDFYFDIPIVAYLLKRGIVSGDFIASHNKASLKTQNYKYMYDHGYSFTCQAEKFIYDGFVEQLRFLVKIGYITLTPELFELAEEKKANSCLYFMTKQRQVRRWS